MMEEMSIYDGRNGDQEHEEVCGETRCERCRANEDRRQGVCRRAGALKR